MPETFDALVDRFLMERWSKSPITATQAGIDGYDEEVGDYSAQEFEDGAARNASWLKAFAALPDADLNDDERLDRDLIVSQLRGTTVAYEMDEWRRRPSLYLNAGLGGVFSLFVHGLHSEEHLARAATARLRQVPGVLAEGKRNLDPALASNLIVERSLGECRAGVRYARELVPAEISDPSLRAGVAEAGEEAARAFEDFADFLEKFAADARGSFAIGEERYSELLSGKEMLGYGAREMRERGRAAFEEIGAEMAARAKAIGGDSNWVALREEVAEWQPATPEDLLAHAQRWTERARAFLVERALVTLPEGERCLVEPAPAFHRPVMAAASYQKPPPFKPSMTGHYFVPWPPDGASADEIKARLLRKRCDGAPTTSVHETYPGHHFHMISSRANERPARKAFGNSYFAEGWGLYAEMMMLEQGFYDDPYLELAALVARLFRAARIVLDTSLHLGEMSEEEAITFMQESLGASEHVARAEVRRYCAWPTQAASYLTGCLEIERMRDRFLAEKRGDLRAFHDRIVSFGSMPIGLTERALFA